MQQLFIDFETYYDDAYSLRSMTYVEYLKDERFACRGASVILNNEEPKWIEAQDLPEYFKQIDWDDTEVIAHNTMFDGTVLAWYYGVTPARWGDTASMANYVFDVPSVSLANVAKLLDLRSKGDALEATKGKENLTAEEAAALADYALDDIIICRDAYVKMEPFMPQTELDLIDMTMRMYLEPKLVLDTPLLTDYLTELAETNEERLLDWSETVAACLPAEYVEWFRDNGRTVFTSNKLFRELLEALGVDIPLKQKRATEHQAKQSVNRINKAKAEIERLERMIEEDKPRLLLDDPEKRAPAEKRTASRLTKLEEARRVAAEKPLKKGAVVYVPALAKNDEAFIEMADTDDEGLSAAASARLQLMSTINESRGKRLVDMAQRMGGKVPVPLKYCGARTNRWSGTQKINMQNLPARGRDRTLRNALTAPPGYKIIAADLAQIEPRVLAWLAGEQFLLDSFASGRDFYTALYVKTFGGDYDEMYMGYKAEDFEWTTKRNVGKAMGLGLGFSMGAKAFRSFAKTAAKQNLTEEEAERIVKAYRDGVPNIVAFWDNCGAMLPAMGSNPMLNSLINRCRFRKGAVILPSGRFLRYDDLRSEEVVILDDEGEIKERRRQWMYGTTGYRSYIYSGKMVENLVQAFARDVVADMAIKVQSILDKRDNEGVVLLVHDEVVLVVHESRAESVAEQVKSIMSTTPEYAPGLPLNCSIKIADNYGEAK